MKPSHASLALFLACGAMFAQTPKPNAAEAVRRNAAAAVAAAAPAPVLSKTEQLQLENFQLKSTLMQQQFQQLQQAYKDLQQQLAGLSESLSAEHPGWRFDLRTQAFVKAPAPAPAATNPAKPEAHK